MMSLDLLLSPWVLGLFGLYRFVRRRKAAAVKCSDKSCALAAKYSPASEGFTPTVRRDSKSSNIMSDQYTSLQKVFIETIGRSQPREL